MLDPAVRELLLMAACHIQANQLRTNMRIEVLNILSTISARTVGLYVTVLQGIHEKEATKVRAQVMDLIARMAFEKDGRYLTKAERDMFEQWLHPSTIRSRPRDDAP